MTYKKQELNGQEEDKKVHYTENNTKAIGAEHNDENSSMTNGSLDNTLKGKDLNVQKYSAEQINSLKLQYLNEKNLKKLV